MEGAHVLAEVVFHGSLGVSLSYLLVAWVGGLVGHEAEHLQIHHVVDDDGILPLLAEIPRADDTQLWVPASE